jgi:hypothetical protein
MNYLQRMNDLERRNYLGLYKYPDTPQFQFLGSGIKLNKLETDFHNLIFNVIQTFEENDYPESAYSKKNIYETAKDILPDLLQRNPTKQELYLLRNIVKKY